MSEQTPFPVLYILARNDLASMNAGKLAAQCSHASNAFVHWIHNGDPVPNGNEIAALYNQWKNETPQGFGTVLVLAVNETQMRTAVDVAGAMGFVSGVVHDPTYPLRDGDTTHFLPVDTCAFVFGDKNDPMLGAVVGNFPLHP